MHNFDLSFWLTVRDAQASTVSQAVGGRGLCGQRRRTTNQTRRLARKKTTRPKPPRLTSSSRTTRRPTTWSAVPPRAPPTTSTGPSAPRAPPAPTFTPASASTLHRSAEVPTRPPARSVIFFSLGVLSWGVLGVLCEGAKSYITNPELKAASSKTGFFHGSTDP